MTNRQACSPVLWEAFTCFPLLVVCSLYLCVILIFNSQPKPNVLLDIRFRLVTEHTAESEHSAGSSMRRIPNGQLLSRLWLVIEYTAGCK